MQRPFLKYNIDMQVNKIIQESTSTLDLVLVLEEQNSKAIQHEYMFCQKPFLLFNCKLREKSKNMKNKCGLWQGIKKMQFV